MNKEQLRKLMDVAQTLDEYAVKHSGNNDLMTLTGNLIMFLVGFDPNQEIPESEKEYSLAEAAALLV